MEEKGISGDKPYSSAPTLHPHIYITTQRRDKHLGRVSVLAQNTDN